METMTSGARGWIHVMGPLTGKDFTDCSNLCIAVTITGKSCAFLLSIIKSKMPVPFSSSRRLLA